MTKLTDTQMNILAAAAARLDGAAQLPENKIGAGASKVGERLVVRKLLREVRSKAGMPIWHRDDKGRPISLVITRAGRDASGVEEKRITVAAPAISSSKLDPTTKRKSKRPNSTVPANLRAEPVDTSSPRPAAASLRPGSKQLQVVALLSKADGATLDDLVKATGWLPHTTRAVLTGLRKKGYAVARLPRADGRPSVYRIAADLEAAA